MVKPAHRNCMPALLSSFHGLIIPARGHNIKFSGVFTLFSSIILIFSGHNEERLQRGGIFLAHALYPRLAALHRPGGLYARHGQAPDGPAPALRVRHDHAHRQSGRLADEQRRHAAAARPAAGGRAVHRALGHYANEPALRSDAFVLLRQALAHHFKGRMAAAGDEKAVPDHRRRAGGAAHIGHPRPGRGRNRHRRGQRRDQRLPLRQQAPAHRRRNER